MTTIQERVAAGARWLDQHEPGWVERIDLEALDLSVCDRCIMGRLAGHFDEALLQWAPDEGQRWAWAAGLGLAHPHPRGLGGYDASSSSPVSDYYETLTADWKTLIAARRVLAS